MGYVLLGMSYYFISVLIPEDKVIIGWALYLMIAGGLMGAFAQLKWEAIWWRHLLKTFGVIIFMIGGFQCGYSSVQIQTLESILMKLTENHVFILILISTWRGKKIREAIVFIFWSSMVYSL